MAVLKLLAGCRVVFFEQIGDCCCELKDSDRVRALLSEQTEVIKLIFGKLVLGGAVAAGKEICQHAHNSAKQLYVLKPQRIHFSHLTQIKVVVVLNKGIEKSLAAELQLISEIAEVQAEKQDCAADERVGVGVSGDLRLQVLFKLVFVDLLEHEPRAAEV